MLYHRFRTSGLFNEHEMETGFGDQKEGNEARRKQEAMITGGK